MLKKGSHITIVTPTGCLQTVLIRTNRVEIEWAPGSYFKCVDEGKLWLRGWHSPESRAAKAAVVAQGLTNELDAAPRPTFPKLSTNSAATIIGAAAGALIANILTSKGKAGGK
ncbi:MAG TPA: hypothetical protein VGY48_15980 [Vicinamibacterales bacterium]|nr:hypothetical protein [Vicinamibacterales bacterium]